MAQAYTYAINVTYFYDFEYGGTALSTARSGSTLCLVRSSKKVTEKTRKINQPGCLYVSRYADSRLSFVSSVQSSKHLTDSKFRMLHKQMFTNEKRARVTLINQSTILFADRITLGAYKSGAPKVPFHFHN